MAGKLCGCRIVTVRPACAADEGYVSSLCTQLGYPSSAKQVLARLRQLLQNDIDAVYVAQLPDSTVIGWVHVALRQLVMVERFAQIEGLVVDDAWRRSGVGRALLFAAEQWTLSKGCHTIRVRSNIVRVGAHQFYEQMGYRAVKQQVSYSKHLEAS